MTNPIRDPDDLSHEKDMPANNYHDEEPEIQNDDVPVHRPNQPTSPRRPTRRPPPKRWYHED
jgi:hypothetical protein